MVGLHFHWYYKIKWVKHTEGKLGYWYCPTCFTPFCGVIHKMNEDGDGASAWRIRELNKTEVRKFLNENL